MHQQAIDHGKPRILFLGDSIVQGHGVARGDVVDRRLEAMLPGHQVLNAAVTGYSVDQYYLYLKRVIGDVQPKVVIVGIFTGNDFQVTGREHGWGHSKPLFALEGGGLYRVDRAGPCIDQMAGSLLFRVLWRDRARAMKIIHALCKPRELSLGELEAVLAKLFVEIEALAAQHGAKTLFVLLPERREYAMFGSDFARYGSRHADFARLLRRGGHAVFDFAVDVARAKGDKPALYLPDNAHMTPRGHAFLAETMVAELRARRLVEQR